VEQEKRQRLIDKLSVELGPKILEALDDEDIIEVMLNPDGVLWTEGHNSGFCRIGEIAALNAEAIIGTVAASVGTTITRTSPVVSGELPLKGERFEGLIPPVVPSPAFTIRKRAIAIYSLKDYVNQGIMSPDIANRLRTAILARKNIVLSGGTGTGKTTLANALIAELASLTPRDRLVIIEDTAEIQCIQENAVVMRTSDEVTMAHLLRSTLRMRPDRIIVGEVRGGEALTLLKSWNTGHPGGIATVHSNTAEAALTRLQQLVAEATLAPMGELIGEAVDLVVSIIKTDQGRRIDDLLEVDRFAGGDFLTRTISSEKEKAAYG
jgi:type IV secretion system protein VirB11